MRMSSTSSVGQKALDITRKFKFVELTKSKKVLIEMYMITFYNDFS